MPVPIMSQPVDRNCAKVEPALARVYDVTFFRPASKISRTLRAMTLLPRLRFNDPPNPVT